MASAIVSPEISGAPMSDASVNTAANRAACSGNFDANARTGSKPPPCERANFSGLFRRGKGRFRTGFPEADLVNGRQIRLTQVRPR